MISALFAGARLLAGKTVQALPVSPVLAVLGVLAFFTLLAVAISWYYGLEANSTILRVRSWSGSYVDIPWPAIEAIAPPLLRHGTLEGKEVSRLAASAMTGRAGRADLCPCQGGRLNKRGAQRAGGV